MTNNQLTEEELQTLIIELQQTAYRLNGTNSAYLMSDAIKPLRELQERRKVERDSEPVAALKLPPKLSNDRERAHELNTGVDTWNRCIDEVAKINGEMIIAGRVDGLHPTTSALVNDFATALAEKLRKAELKYGYSNAWTNNGWMTECLADFHRHIAKGDPRDVAAYCAFMWYHGWKTEAAQPAPVVQCPFPCGWDNLNKLAIQDAALVARGLVEGEPTTEAHRQAAISNNDRLLKVITACRAAMLQAGNSPVIPEGYVMVPKEPTEAMINAWLSEVANWRGHVAGYKAMLATAPQEVK
ncbi:hypothetical protein [Klebsiella pneumoniae]|uniref:hypothetical protein n=1 Tax=Klebsiella pneumoniae TaxID=573 RepID=UPI000CDDEFB4|nr:hypothetical protein [Klebsiella pneumoniae]POW75397.1 hypothetical protein C3398_22290 [Klebsiella pneumoniae]HCJ3121280.1 hypothetical protein [Klebsiella pneumoniae]